MIISFIIYLIVEGAAGFVMATFEQIFKIKEGHTLKEVRAHHGNYDDDWKHEERDAQGELVARYESWDYMAPRQPHILGWLKFSPDGRLLEEHDELPL
jgi:hypothetical protein